MHKLRRIDFVFPTTNSDCHDDIGVTGHILIGQYGVSKRQDRLMRTHRPTSTPSRSASATPENISSAKASGTYMASKPGSSEPWLSVPTHNQVVFRSQLAAHIVSFGSDDIILHSHAVNSHAPASRHSSIYIHPITITSATETVLR